ncbi:MAG: hypothetical protein Q4G67_07265 [Actinomycetia bacterium]|nr:hypothetical protein [Actinomycetes bacterium]
MDANERAIVDQTQQLVDGGRSASLRTILYALYVTALLLLSYGLTFSYAFFATQDPQWLRAQVLSWPALLALAVVALLGLATAWRAGQIRGPALPPLPWIDLIVSGPVDRAITLRRWWLMSAVLLVTGAVMVGAVIGGGAWTAQVGDPLWLIIGSVVATGLGLLLLLVWLAGQVAVGASGRVPPAWAPRRALRLLRLEDLRTQSSRGSRMGGAVLLGDLRALRLETAPPVTRGRSHRLKPGPSWAAIPRRDLLGALRQPGSLVIAAAVTVVAAATLSWSLLHPAVPVLFVLAAGLALHLGLSTAAEGLRLHGDNTGTPPLLGFSARGQAIGHLVLPLVVCATVAKASAALVAWAGGASGVSVLGIVAWVGLMVLLVAGTVTASAFRGGAPVDAFLPQTGPIMMVVWVARQLLVATAAVGGLTAWAARDGFGAVLVAGVLATLASLWWGLSRVAAMTIEHRD